MREPNLELWHQRRQELEREAEMNHLGRKLRAARRKAPSRTGVGDGGLTAWIGGKITAVRRVLKETGAKIRLHPRRHNPSGCAK
jgi:hypothetical protein